MAKWGYISTALQGISALLLLATSAWLISRAAEHPPIMYLMVAVVGVRAFALGRSGFRYAERITLHSTAFSMASQLRPRLFAALIPKAPGELGDISRGGFVSSVVSDVEEQQNRTIRIVGPAVQVVATALVGIAISFWLAPKAGFSLLALTCLALFLILPLSARISATASKNITDLRAELSALNVSTTENFAVLAAFDWLGDSLAQAAKLSHSLNRAERRITYAAATSSALINLVSSVSVLLALVFASEALAFESLAPVSVAVLGLMPIAVFETIQANSALFQVRHRVRASSRRLEELLSSGNAKTEHEDTSKIELGRIAELELRKVAVSYDGATNVIQGFDLHLKQGQTAALRGRSGSGKTSIAYLLLGFLNSNQGEYLINGKPAAAYVGDSIRSKIGYLEQSVSVFMGTLRENLKIAAPDASDDQLWNALEIARLAETFRTRAGLDTQLGERGQLISAGEAQRVGLARLILKEFEFVILDEPTSNLDRKTADILLDDIFSISESRGMGLLLITHDELLAARCQVISELPQLKVAGV